MTRLDQIPVPPAGATKISRFAIAAREKRAFHSILDAHALLDRNGKNESVVTLRESGADVVLETDHPMLGGRIHETVHYARTETGLVTRSLARRVVKGDSAPTRDEKVTTFDHGAIGLPLATYPEVTLPFIAGFLPLDGARRSLYAWINDRFVAKVYLEAGHRSTLSLPIGKRDAIEVVMYPDLNDWVRLGSVLSRLAKPFIPKYHMWFSPESPHDLLRFEGPYGPPGAPEIVLERIT